MAQDNNNASPTNLEVKADKAPAQAPVTDPKPEQTTPPAEADKTAPAQK